MEERMIIVPQGRVKLLARIFDTSTVTVWSALGFKSNSELAERIRNFALDTEEVGGKMWEVKKENSNHN